MKDVCALPAMVKEDVVSGALPVLLSGEPWQPFLLDLRGLDLPSAPGPSPGPTLKESFLQRVLGDLSQGQHIRVPE